MLRDFIYRGSLICVIKKKRNGICINSCIDGYFMEMLYCGVIYLSGNVNFEFK